MPDDARHHHVVADVLHGVVAVGRGGEAATGALQDEREDVAEDEDPGVVPGGQAGVLGADFDDDVLRCRISQHVHRSRGYWRRWGKGGGEEAERWGMGHVGSVSYLECEIDPRSNKCRRDDQAADLGLKAGLAPWVTVHHDPSDVSDCFAQAAEEEGDQVCPCSGFEAEAAVADGEEGEEGKEEGIGAEIGVVAVDGGFDGAFGGDIDTDAPGVVGGGGCGGVVGSLAGEEDEGVHSSVFLLRVAGGERGEVRGEMGSENG